MIEFPRDANQVLADALGTTVKVLGVGGAGCNVVDRMAMDGMDAAEVVTLNTDARALMHAVTADRIQLGAQLTRGLGAGGDPDIGRAATMESEAEIRATVHGRKLVFICAGLGGGTGSGAAPEVARIAREAGAMVITFATLPFSFEGKRRVNQAAEALESLRAQSDAVIVFENDRMGEVILATEGVQKAFEAADRLVGRSIRGVAAIITRPGLIRVGLDDLLTVLRPSAGHCLFGHGSGEGENRAKEALDRALRSPLLNRGRMLNQASAVLVHVTGGEDLRLFEVQTLMRELGRHVDERAQIFFGMAVDPALKKSLAVTVFSPLAEELPEETAPDETGAMAPGPAPETAPEPVPVPSPFESILPEEFPPAAEAAPVPATQPGLLPDLEEAPEAPDSQAVESTELFATESNDAAGEEVPPLPTSHTQRLILRPPAPEPELDPDPVAPEPLPTGKTTRIRLGQALRPPVRPMDELAVPSDPTGQRELQLGARNDGGRFDKAEPTVIDGEDLDLPAYLRKRRRP